MIEFQPLGAVDRHDLHRRTPAAGGPADLRFGLRVQIGEQALQILRSGPFAWPLA